MECIINLVEDKRFLKNMERNGYLKDETNVPIHRLEFLQTSIKLKLLHISFIDCCVIIVTTCMLN